MAGHIGIVAGSGEGAALCYRTIVNEGAARMGRHGHPEITMHTLPFSDYMAPIEGNRWEEVGRLMLESGRRCAEAGADFLVCPDNTFHQGLDLVIADSPLPWLHIAEEIARVAHAGGFRTLGLTGTAWLMEGPVYPSKLKARGIEVRLPSPDTRREIDRIIFDELVRGRFEEKARAYFRKVIRGLADDGCDAVILGCTEIPILISQADSPIPVLDSTRTLARAALGRALDGN